MQLTFTLQSIYTGATYVAGPFNISGTTDGGTTYELANGVTKSQLITGHTINTTYETLTGGTITSTGTCGTSQSWTTGIGGSPSVSLEVYGKDEDGTPGNVTVFYTINGGSTINLVTNTPLLGSCSLLGTITGLALSDDVMISTSETYPISGADTSTCPTLSGTATTYSHTVGISSGTDYVAFSINSNVSV
jgi:hypothetical protein